MKVFDKIITALCFRARRSGLRWLSVLIIKKFSQSTPRTKKNADVILWPNDLAAVLYRYGVSFQSMPNLVSPKKFNEILQKNKFSNRSDLHMVVADKLAVKEYVQNRVPALRVPRTLWQGREFADIDLQALPQRFVIKANNSQGAVIKIDQGEVNDWRKIGFVADQWLNQNISVDTAEWQYRWICPCLFVEEDMSDEAGRSPDDLKFWTFHGRVEAVQIDRRHEGKHLQAFVDRKWRRLPFSRRGIQQLSVLPACPDGLNELIEIAETFGQQFDFVRCDLYWCASEPVFGELTLYPGAGFRGFEPSSWDEYFGKLLLKA